MYSRRGMTLVELLVAVAIIGVLASIAIPLFATEALKARRAEVAPLVGGMVHAAIAYEAATDQQVEVLDFVPDSSPGKTPRAWITGTGFDTLGWGPDGEVRGSYRLEMKHDEIHAEGACDVDADGDWAWFLGSNEASVAMLSPINFY